MCHIRLVGYAILLFVLSYANAAAEYGCQDGYVPVNHQGGGGGCVVDYNLPYWSNRGAASERATPQRAIWADRWGALVINPITGIMGAAEGEASKPRAEQAAYAQCGSGCRAVITYHNQCMAAAWSERGFNANSGASVEIATERAKKVCSKGGGTCEIVYTACSPAQRVQ